jgi:hypothetical protein
VDSDTGVTFPSQVAILKAWKGSYQGVSSFQSRQPLTTTMEPFNKYDIWDKIDGTRGFLEPIAQHQQ